MGTGRIGRLADTREELMFLMHEDWSDVAAWDAFVLRHAHARFCHLFSYSDAVRCYGYRPRRLCFTFSEGNRAGEIAAVLPAIETSNYWYGRRLISQPFCEYGGLLIDADVPGDKIKLLVDALHGYLAEKAPGATLEMHGNLGVPREQHDLFVQRNPHMLASLPLHEGADTLWSKTIKYEVRKQVNQARRANVTVIQECDGDVIRRHFFPLYAASMKRLGVPPHDVQYYLDCARLLGDNMQIFWAVRDSKRIAALLGFSSGARTAIINTVSDPANWQYRPNDLLHWEYICSAIERGCTHFDFGSVRYDGQRLFKSKWGCELIDQAYCLLPASLQQPRTLDSSSTTMQRLSQTWARYVPRPVADRFGPLIRQLLAR